MEETSCQLLAEEKYMHIYTPKPFNLTSFLKKMLHSCDNEHILLPRYFHNRGIQIFILFGEIFQRRSYSVGIPNLLFFNIINIFLITNQNEPYTKQTQVKESAK